MISTDHEAIKLIRRLYDCQELGEEEWTEIVELLEEYVPGSTEVMRRSKEFLPPEEILKKAREMNKPILL